MSKPQTLRRGTQVKTRLGIGRVLGVGHRDGWTSSNIVRVSVNGHQHLFLRDELRALPRRSRK